MLLLIHVAHGPHIQNIMNEVIFFISNLEVTSWSLSVCIILAYWRGSVNIFIQVVPFLAEEKWPFKYLHHIIWTDRVYNVFYALTIFLSCFMFNHSLSSDISSHLTQLFKLIWLPSNVSYFFYLTIHQIKIYIQPF